MSSLRTDLCVPTGRHHTLSMLWNCPVTRSPATHQQSLSRLPLPQLPHRNRTYVFSRKGYEGIAPAQASPNPPSAIFISPHFHIFTSSHSYIFKSPPHSSSMLQSAHYHSLNPAKCPHCLHRSAGEPNSAQQE